MRANLATSQEYKKKGASSVSAGPPSGIPATNQMMQGNNVNINHLSNHINNMMLMQGQG